MTFTKNAISISISLGEMENNEMFCATANSSTFLKFDIVKMMKLAKWKSVAQTNGANLNFIIKLKIKWKN